MSASAPTGERSGLAMLVFWVLSTMTLWGVAFYPAQVAPEWLVRTQYVCFGTGDNGLPAPYGWILLGLAPASLLFGLVVSHGVELQAALRLALRSTPGRVAASWLLLTFLAEVVWIGSLMAAANPPAPLVFETGELPPDYPRTEKRLPEFELVDQTGAKLDHAQLEGKVTFVSFVFAHCASVCPGLVMDIRASLSELDPERTRAVLITLDPWRDTPSSLPHLAEQWAIPTNAHLASGTVEDVQRALDRFDVPRVRNERTGEVDHPALVYVVDEQGRIAYTFNGAPREWLTEAARRLTRGRPAS